MKMLKIAGLMGIVIASGLIGMMKAAELKRRKELLEDFLKMVIELKGQINYFREPLPRIFSRLKKNSRTKAFDLLRELEDGETVRTGEITEAWPVIIRQSYEKEPLTGDDIKIMKYLGEFIGQTDFENHLYHFSYLEEKLKDQIKDSTQISEKKGPMYRKLGFFLGGMIAIILF